MLAIYAMAIYVHVVNIFAYVDHIFERKHTSQRHMHLEYTC